jgi:hypothetical protein
LEEKDEGVIMYKGRPVVHVIGPTFALDVLFTEHGYYGITDAELSREFEIDLACFTGGADINPKIYGAEREKHTQYPCDHRDTREIGFWRSYKDMPKVGICRGAQLINALNGGSMIQHVDGHVHGTHKLFTRTGDVQLTSSVHHQMMIPCKEAELVAWAEGVTFKDKRPEPEVLWLKHDRSLLFQGHPEFGPKPCTEYFFELMAKYIDPLLKYQPDRAYYQK